MITYGKVTECLRPLFRDGDVRVMEGKPVHRLLREEAEGRPVTQEGDPGAEIFVRMRFPAIVFLVLRRATADSLQALKVVRDCLSFRFPVVVVAPPASSEFKMQMLEQGIYAFVEEPVQPGQIQRLVEEIRMNTRAGIEEG